MRDQSGNDAASTAHARGHVEVEQLILNWSRLGSGDQPSLGAGSKRELTIADLVSKDVVPARAQRNDPTLQDASILNDDLPVAVADTLTSPLLDTTSDLDLSGWEEEIEAPAPLHDPSISANAIALQSLISQHVVIDTDEKWDEVEIDLPDAVDLRPRGIRLRPAQREDIRLLVVEALRDGRIQENRLLDLKVSSLEDGDEDHSNFHIALRMVLEDLGVLIDEADAPDPIIVPDEADDEVYGDAAYGAVAYLSRHLTGQDDLYFRFLASMPKPLPSRAEETALAEKRDEGFLEAMRALASCESVVAKLRRDLGDVLSGRLALRVLVDVEGVAKDEAAYDAADGDGAVDDTEASPVNATTSENLETARFLFDACSRVERDPEHLARCLTAAGLEDNYFRKLCNVNPPGSQTRVRIAAGLRAVEIAEMQLVERNLRLVAHFANKWGRSLPRMDRLQEGTFGLIRAARKFSGSRGNKFATYAVWWIRQAIHRAAADTARVIRLPVHIQEASRKVDRAVKALDARSVRHPSVDQIAMECGLPSERVAKLLKLTPEPISFADVEDEIFEIPDPALGPEDMCNEDDLRHVVANLLSTLDPRSERVVRLRFGIGCDEHTLEEIGQMYGVTRERIRQIEAKALQQLGHPGRCKHLRGAY